MLQALGLRMDFVPWKIEHVMKESFQQAMVPENFQRSPLAPLSQADAMMLFVFDKRWLLIRQFLQHPGDRGCADFQMSGQGVAGYPLSIGTAQFQDCLEVIVDCFTRRWSRRFISHYSNANRSCPIPQHFVLNLGIPNYASFKILSQSTN